MWWWIVISLLAIAAAVVLLSETALQIKYKRAEENDEVNATVIALFGLVRLRYRVPAIRLVGMFKGIYLRLDKENVPVPPVDETFTADELSRMARSMRKLIRHMADYKDWLTGTLGRTHIDKVRWSTRIGLGDARDTAVSTGIVWSVKSSLLGQMLRYFQLDTRPVLSVEPDFKEICFRTEAEFHTRIRVYHLLVALSMLVVRVLRRENGWKVWLKTLLQTAAK